MLHPLAPAPWCPVCAHAAACEAAGVLRPDYPACRAPPRGAPPGRVGALLEAMRLAAGAEDARLPSLLGAIAARHAEDDTRLSEVLEPSVSWDGGACHTLRLTYGFPAYREEPERALGTIADWCGHLGPGLAGWARDLLRPARDRAVHHPLFGLAWDGPGRWRAKVYLEFPPETGERALALAAKLLGGDPGVRHADRPLHIVGLDLGPRGISAAKLYFLARDLSLSSPPEGIAGLPLALDLAAAGVKRLRQAILIHRLRRPGDADGALPRELCVPLAPNDLHWASLARLPSVARVRRPEDAFARMERAFRLGVRMVTGGPGGKLNAYYVLAETPGPAPTPAAAS